MSASISRRTLLPMAGALFLAARAQAQPTRPAIDFAVPDFGGLPLRLDAGRMIVTRGFEPSDSPPRFEGRMIVSALDVMADWASKHLQAGRPGGPRTAVFTIREASLIGQPVRVEKGIGDLFRKQIAERYSMKLAADLEIQDEAGQSLGVAMAEATSTQGMLEDAKDADRQVAWHNMLIAAMDRFVPTFEQTIRSRIANLLAGG